MVQVKDMDNNYISLRGGFKKKLTSNRIQSSREGSQQLDSRRKVGEGSGHEFRNYAVIFDRI